ncbi:MAG: hypothetical protein ABJF88_16780 [Rhodothermales bacterium]
MNDERRYSEAELRAIFERAAKRQEEASRAEAASHGHLTLRELQEIGGASGIDPAHIAAAAAELAVAAPAKPAHTFLGAPTEVERTRVFPGAVSDEVWARMVAEVRRTFDEDGSVGQIGQMREWTAVKRVTNNSGSAMRLALEPLGDGRTRATLRQSVRETTRGFTIAAAIGAVMTVLFVALALIEAEPDVLIAAVMMGTMALGFSGGTWGWLKHWRPKQEEKFDAVLDRLELLARDQTPEPARAARPAEKEAPATAQPDTERRLDLDALPDIEEEQAAPDRTRTRS